MLATRPAAALVALTLALSSAPLASAQTFPITIDPVAYAGRWGMNAFCGGSSCVGKQTLNLAPGDYGIDVGAGIGPSEFGFTVDGSGNVTVSSAASATGGFETLTFNNVSVTVDPNQYDGNYFLSSFGEFQSFTGLHTFVLVPALTYAVDDGVFALVTIGGTTYDSGVYFAVDATGHVGTISNAAAATANGTSLLLGNAAISIHPNLYAGQYYVSNKHFTLLTGVQTVTIIPGLPAYFDDGASVEINGVASAEYFVSDEAGNVTAANNSAAFGGAGTLTFNNVRVHIDPGTYAGTYSGFGGQSFTGPVNVELIPNLVTGFFITSEFPQYLVPGTASVNPSSASVSDGTNSYTFSFSIAANVMVTSVSPSTLDQGATSQTLTVTGTGFVTGATLAFNSSGITVSGATVSSSTQLTATVSIAANTPTGTYNATVTNPDASFGTGVAALTVTSPSTYAGTIVNTVQTAAAAGQIAAGQASSLTGTITNAQRQIGVNNTAAGNILASTLNKLSAWLASGKITQAAYDALVAQVNALISSL